jgi:putative SOS response-associated peptidase YedK
MCGRYTLILLHDLNTIFPWIDSPDDPDTPSRYNIAPTQPVLAATNDVKPGSRAKFDYLIWGLIPSWAKDPKIGNRMINARAETLAEKPAFRTALRRRRCLIPADGFYEWKKEADGTKTPMYIRREDGKPFAFAGLWDHWHDPAGTGTELRSCTIITTRPNELMEPIHDRMPAIVPVEQQKLWLSSGELDPADVGAALGPYPAQEMEVYAVSRLVNNPRNERAECVERAAGGEPGTP